MLIDYLCQPVGGRLPPGSDVGEVAIADPDRLELYALTDKAIEVIAKALTTTDD